MGTYMGENQSLDNSLDGVSACAEHVEIFVMNIM